jgi:hypothetical protein
MKATARQNSSYLLPIICLTSYWQHSSCMFGPGLFGQAGSQLPESRD